MSDLEGFAQASPRTRLGVGAVVVLVILALAITVAIGIWRGARAPVETVDVDVSAPDATADDAGGDPTALPDAVYVHVDGAVRAPGLYVLDPGSRAVDAITAAGGLDDEAVRDAVNLARVVADGEQIVIPREGEQATVETAGGAEAGGETGGLVNVNQADASQLETLPGIGPALAQRVIAWREAEGPFASVDDLLAVSGIGPKVLDGLRDQATA
ncbi:helix-hairpin-helix domain-containing protein [Microbacterium sp. gxy059]|uniref:helix-hairpin-helix domain-containing protein n=1 Tax=Microbacterium sp. gxy059 TaxID=2957199 RepID=UPI003D9726CC